MLEREDDDDLELELLPLCEPESLPEVLLLPDEFLDWLELRLSWSETLCVVETELFSELDLESLLLWVSLVVELSLEVSDPVFEVLELFA